MHLVSILFVSLDSRTFPISILLSLPNFYIVNAFVASTASKNFRRCKTNDVQNDRVRQTRLAEIV